jgi:hypothetical protein
VLYTEKGERLAGSLTAKDDGLTMCDPFEPDYDGGSKTKAIFYWNDGKHPIINSQAHGGMIYTLPFFYAEKNAPPNEDWKAELVAHVEKFNRNHAQIIIGAKHRIMRIIQSSHSPNGRETLEFFSQNELEKIYQNTVIKTGEKLTQFGIKEFFDNHIGAWAKHYKSRVYRGGVVFLPNAPYSEHYFNTWRGFAVQPKPAKNAYVLERIYCHIEQVICKNDPALITYFYNWIAYSLQKPDKPAGAALVLRGGKGTGKGTIGHFLKNIWGVHGVHISNAKHLIGNFNGHLADTCFLFAD